MLKINIYNRVIINVHMWCRKKIQKKTDIKLWFYRAGSLVKPLPLPILIPMPLPMPLTKKQSLNSDSLGDSLTTRESLENHRHLSFSASGDSQHQQWHWQRHRDLKIQL